MNDLKQKLLNIKKEIVQRNNKVEEIDLSGDDIDLIQGTYIAEMCNQLSQRDIFILNKINLALIKIENGTYGLCLACDSNIPIKRLEISPYTEYCVCCLEEIEKNK